MLWLYLVGVSEIYRTQNLRGTARNANPVKSKLLGVCHIITNYKGNQKDHIKHGRINGTNHGTKQKEHSQLVSRHKA